MDWSQINPAECTPLVAIFKIHYAKNVISSEIITITRYIAVIGEKKRAIKMWKCATVHWMDEIFICLLWWEENIKQKKVEKMQLSFVPTCHIDRNRLFSNHQRD